MHIFLQSDSSRPITTGIKSKMVVTGSTGNPNTGIDKKKPEIQPDCSSRGGQSWKESHRNSSSLGLDDRNKMKGSSENIEHM